jgi:hypothetical protein
MDRKLIKLGLLGHLVFLSLPALATLADNGFMARFGFGVMIFSGFLALVLFGTIPYWFEKWSNRMRIGGKRLGR